MDSQQRVNVEWLKCSKSFAYFVDTYILIYDAVKTDWIPFRLWPDQKNAAMAIAAHALTIILKARQLGMTWLCLAYLLWLMIFRASATVLVFSRRETEAAYLMWRLREMYKRIPEWMQAREVLTDNTLAFQLSNGSIAYGFPTTAGDSYTATAALVDEADLLPDLNALMAAVKPTIDAGGSMMMISRSNKKEPNSPFKKLFRDALNKLNPWFPVFLPWWVRPERTHAWYEDIKNDSLSRTGTLDELHEQYPETVDEALEALSTDKRIPPKLLREVFEPMQYTKGDLPGLVIFKAPELMGRYVIGADPAEGNPSSDDSVADVLDTAGEQCATISGKFEPAIFASYLEELSTFYNRAKIMPERNNHGHVLIAELPPELILKGSDDKPGWHTNIKSKAQMYSSAIEYLKDKATKIHSQTTNDQLLSIVGETLRAPDGMLDDFATSYCLALCGLGMRLAKSFAMEYTNMPHVMKNRREALAEKMRNAPTIYS
jgi:hypothetical protein